jgi:hypothetical protein
LQLAQQNAIAQGFGGPISGASVTAAPALTAMSTSAMQVQGSLLQTIASGFEGSLYQISADAAISAVGTVADRAFAAQSLKSTFNAVKAYQQSDGDWGQVYLSVLGDLASYYTSPDMNPAVRSAFGVTGGSLLQTAAGGLVSAARRSRAESVASKKRKRKKEKDEGIRERRRKKQAEENRQAFAQHGGWAGAFVNSGTSRKEFNGGPPVNRAVRTEFV